MKEKNVSVKSKPTLPYSRGSIEELSTCLTHGEQFIATGGMHLITDDVLKASGMRWKKLKVADIKLTKQPEYP